MKTIYARGHFYFSNHIGSCRRLLRSKIRPRCPIGVSTWALAGSLKAAMQHSLLFASESDAGGKEA